MFVGAGRFGETWTVVVLAGAENEGIRKTNGSRWLYIAISVAFIKGCPILMWSFGPTMVFRYHTKLTTLDVLLAERWEKKSSVNRESSRGGTEEEEAKVMGSWCRVLKSFRDHLE